MTGARCPKCGVFVHRHNAGVNAARTNENVIFKVSHVFTGTASFASSPNRLYLDPHNNTLSTEVDGNISWHPLPAYFPSSTAPSAPPINGASRNRVTKQVYLHRANAPTRQQKTRLRQSPNITTRAACIATSVPYWSIGSPAFYSPATPVYPPTLITMADRTSAPPSQPQQRDTVFCHQCENEWYRDEHGLTCPDCQSEFTEIIETDHDPRDEYLPEEPQHPLGSGAHGHQEFYGAPDPDEEDIDSIGGGGGGGMRWEQTAPGQMRGTFNRTYHFGGGGPGQGQQGGGLGGGLLGVVGSMLNGAFNTAAQQGQQQQGQHDRHSQGQQPRSDDSRPMSPEGDQTWHAQSAPEQDRGGPNVRHYRSPFGHVTVATSSSTNFGGGGLFPRNANGPQPPQHQPEGMDEFMRMMFNIGVPMGGRMAGGPPGMHMPGTMPMGGGGNVHPLMGGPIDGLLQMLGGMPMGGVHGDAVFSQEDLDRVVTQLMEQHQSGNAPGPASETAIESLPTRQIEEKDVGDQGKADCSICMDEVRLGDKVTVLPCSHWFHGDCIRAWLGEHDTCPHCRQGIMPKEGGQGASGPRDPDQAPLHDMTNPPPQAPNAMPGSFSGGERGETPFSQDSGYASQRSGTPGVAHQAGSTGSTNRRPHGQRLDSGRGQSGIFQQMRNAFGSPGGRGGSAGPGPGQSG